MQNRSISSITAGPGISISRDPQRIITCTGIGSVNIVPRDIYVREEPMIGPSGMPGPQGVHTYYEYINDIVPIIINGIKLHMKIRDIRKLLEILNIVESIEFNHSTPYDYSDIIKYLVEKRNIRMLGIGEINNKIMNIIKNSSIKYLKFRNSNHLNQTYKKITRIYVKNTTIIQTIKYFPSLKKIIVDFYLNWKCKEFIDEIIQTLDKCKNLRSIKLTHDLDGKYYENIHTLLFYYSIEEFNLSNMCRDCLAIDIGGVWFGYS